MKDKKLLEAALFAMNALPNTRINHPEFKNTYELASALGKTLRDQPAAPAGNDPLKAFKVSSDFTEDYITRDEEDARLLFSQWKDAYGTSIRLYEAEVPADDTDEFQWEIIDCYDEDEPAPPPAGNDPELKTFIIGYSNDENVTEGLMQFKDKADADFRSEEWCEVKARTLQEAFDKYEEAFLKWKGEQSKIHPGTPAGNDLPQQPKGEKLFVREINGNTTGIYNEAGILAKCTHPHWSCPEEFLDLMRRYNDFPALQEQNKELLALVDEFRYMLVHLEGDAAGNRAKTAILDKCPNVRSTYSKMQQLLLKYSK